VQKGGRDLDLFQKGRMLKRRLHHTVSEKNKTICLGCCEYRSNNAYDRMTEHLKQDVYFCVGHIILIHRE